MQEFQDREEFRAAVQRLDGLHSRCKTDPNFLMLFKKQEPNKNDIYLILRCYNGKMLWMEKINRPCIDEMRKKSEVQGSYFSFCEMLKQCIDNQNYDLVEYDCELSIVFYFKVTRDVQLKGILEMHQGVPLGGDEDMLKLQSEFVYDLYEAQKTNQVIYTKEVGMLKKKKTQQLIDVDQVVEKKPLPPPPPKKNLLAQGFEALEGEIEKKVKPTDFPYKKQTIKNE